MGFFGLVVWVLVIWLVIGLMRGRGWGCWNRGAAVGDADELERQRSYVETLERRVVELEERLDFTERLLANRPETAAGR